MNNIKKNILIVCRHCGYMKITKRFDEEDPKEAVFLTTKDCPNCDGDTELVASPSEYDFEDDRRWYGKEGAIEESLE